LKVHSAPFRNFDDLRDYLRESSRSGCRQSEWPLVQAMFPGMLVTCTRMWQYH